MQPFVAPKECRRKMNGGCTDGLPRGNAVGSGGNRSTTATAGFRFSAGLTVPPALLLAWVGLLEGVARRSDHGRRPGSRCRVPTGESVGCGQRYSSGRRSDAGASSTPGGPPRCRGSGWGAVQWKVWGRFARTSPQACAQRASNP